MCSRFIICLSSIVDLYYWKRGGDDDHKKNEISILTMNKMLVRAPKLMRLIWSQLGFANHALG